MNTSYVLWFVALGIGVLFGWAWGRTTASAELPENVGRWREGYVTGYEEARDDAIKLARAHDFAVIDRQLTRLQANP